MIDHATSNNATVLSLLRAHPGVVATDEGDKLLQFTVGDRSREVRQGDPSAEVFGLMELVDNNPLVCADVASIPSPAATLVSIALGPVLLAGASLVPPIIQLNTTAQLADVQATLKAIAPPIDIRMMTPAMDPSVATFVEGGLFGKGVASLGLLAVQVAMEVDRSLGLAEVTAMFDERFGRSFYIRRADTTGFFRPDDLINKTYASYRVGTSRASSNTMLLVEVAADPNGKPGAAGLIHAMNIMAGLEESAGIPA